MTEPATRTDPPAPGTDTVTPGPARISRGSARLRVAGLPLDFENQELARDIRARRPNVVSALIQARALERAARIGSLLALDFAAIRSDACAATPARCRISSISS